MTTESRGRVSPRLHDSIAVVALLIAFGFALLSPTERIQGDLARMLYIHVPSVIVAYTAFIVTMASTIGYLIKRDLRWDHWAGASAEVGVVFLGLTLATGMIWAKPVWGVWWTWDARLTLTALMFFVYVGYLGVRRSIRDPELRAARSAVLGIVAVLLIPIVHFSVTWWRTLHQAPTLLRPGEPQIDGPLLTAEIVGIVAFLLVSSALIRRRLSLSRIESRLHAAGLAPDAPLAGDAVTAPQLGSAPVEETAG